MGSALESVVETSPLLIVRQIKEWVEIIIDFETRNQYEILSENGERHAFVIERHQGLLSTLARIFLRSHRPLEIDVLDNQSSSLFQLSRKFFFFFSDLFITDSNHQNIGSIHRRFGIIYKKYDLHDKLGNVFAHVKAPIWRLWTFPVTDTDGRDAGKITKKWQGLLKEAFSDADSFVVEYGDKAWSTNQRLVLLFTAVSIDFDFFEDNDANN